jgi:arabinofuranan 3-O-arabinosyltransferase
VIWRQSVAYEIKAAALALAALVTTPYLYLYDLVVLAVPMAFLVRLGLREGFLTSEIGGLALASALVLITPFVPAQTGLLAVLLVALLVARRAIVGAPLSARALSTEGAPV